MKLSRSAWNNVIIISALLMILLINLINHKLFPDDNEQIRNAEGEHFILSAHAVILTLEVQDNFIIERIGQSWRIEAKQGLADINKQVIRQMMLAWQQSSGLLQADSIDVLGQKGVDVLINVAGTLETKRLTLYPLIDQLLIHDNNLNLWLATSPQRYRQLMPIEVNKLLI
jgi:hypothetical protein|tara:strand:- start:3497 stop:4009 length:513 start_codon:yes stop_codon:yes gene_type:complete